jgi:hypothetical protein
VCFTAYKQDFGVVSWQVKCLQTDEVTLRKVLMSVVDCTGRRR